MPNLPKELSSMATVIGVVTRILGLILKKQSRPSEIMNTNRRWSRLATAVEEVEPGALKRIDEMMNEESKA